MSQAIQETFTLTDGLTVIHPTPTPRRENVTDVVYFLLLARIAILRSRSYPHDVTRINALLIDTITRVSNARSTSRTEEDDEDEESEDDEDEESEDDEDEESEDDEDEESERRVTEI